MADALWRCRASTCRQHNRTRSGDILGQILDEDRAGVTTDHIRIVLPALRDSVPGAEQSRDELQRQWMARGAATVHGRSVSFVVVPVELQLPDMTTPLKMASWRSVRTSIAAEISSRR